MTKLSIVGFFFLMIRLKVSMVGFFFLMIRLKDGGRVAASLNTSPMMIRQLPADRPGKTKQKIPPKTVPTSAIENVTVRHRTVDDPSKRAIDANDDDNNGPATKIPFVLSPWICLYRAIPRVRLPFTNIDFTFTVISALFLTAVDAMSARILIAAGWPVGPETRSVAGSLTTILHSTCLVLSLGGCLSSQPYSPSARMSSHPRWWQDAASALIQFCTGYMIYDAGVQFVADRWIPGVGPVLSATDYMFLGHHAATAAYMTSARVIGAGHVSAMILMFFGEITAPLMNVNRILRVAVEVGIGSDDGVLRRIVEYIFSLSYVVFRAVIGPLCAVHLTYDLLFTDKGRKNVPVGVSLVWLTLAWAVMIGSIPWITTTLKVLRAGI